MASVACIDTILDCTKAWIALKLEVDETERCSASETNSAPCSVEKQVCDGALVAKIHEFLQRKFPEIQKIFYLYYSLNLTTEEIAVALSTNQSNVKNLYRTRAQLRTQFGSEV